MTLDAVNNPVITRIRDAVPEFEDAFQRELRDEEGELGAFQAMSLFAEWVAEESGEQAPTMRPAAPFKRSRT